MRGPPTRFTYAAAEVERALAEAREFPALDQALADVMNLREGFREPEIYARTLYCTGIDALVPRVARGLNLLDRPAPGKSNDNPVIVATKFYGTGGHTQIARDIVARLPADATAAIYTDVYSELRYHALQAFPGLRSDLGERATLILDAASPSARILELYAMLAALRPTRIVLMCHPMDIVAVAGCWPFRDVVDFIHHVDHVPAVGAALPFSGHVDVTYTCHLACRGEGLDAVYAGMAAPRAPPSARPPRPPGRPIRIATSGNPHKFKGRRSYGWTDFAVAALRRPDTEIVHIGPAHDWLRDEVGQALAGAGVDPARYVFQGFVPSLHAALLELETDVYLSSFPEPGGKASLEAMAAHLPMILPVPHDQPPLARFRLPLHRWIEIERPDQLPAALDAALALGDALRSPAEVARLEAELARFDRWVAGERPAPVPAERLPD